ncbi:hypothetical protein B0J12DRAFT_701481 [Macrophomina phaseolina]|uniref:Uncharacterized protein n=1 Tax=Macrophomina phaseolina TaxID=35725 RepID=A0ABQ8G4D3_9PEZI|nr:hypothetical protein B0J12DRAFT_701481 [Macrophomina phaseolina]
MRFTTALAFTGLASAAAVLQPRATTYQILIDTGRCADSADYKAQITGTGAYAGIDHVDPNKLDAYGWTDIRPGDPIMWSFDVPADYTGHVWLYDTTKGDVPADGLAVYGLDIEVYNQPTEEKPNKATLKALGDATNDMRPGPLRTAAFYSQDGGVNTDWVSSADGGSVKSTVVGDGISVIYCGNS